MNKVLLAIKEKLGKTGTKDKKEYLETAAFFLQIMFLQILILPDLQSKEKEERKEGEENPVYQE